MTDTAILGAGGSERFLRNLLQRLPQERYAVDVLQLSAPPSAQQSVGEFDAPAVRLIHRPIGASYGWRGLSTLRFVRGLVGERRYDIVQSQHEKSDLINALLPRSVRKISNRRDMGFQKTDRVRAVFRHLNRRFDRFVAPTTSILDSLIADENVDARDCRRIANGVDTQRFRPADQSRRAALRAQLGVTADAPLIGCVASFSPVKRHIDLLAAFALVTQRHPSAQLLLVGEGPLRADIEAQIAELDLSSRVHLLGPRNDVENILPALDVFALVSSTEGMSNAILEAQACAVAVVATAVGGNLELVRPDQNGLLVPALAPDALAVTLAGLLEDPPRLAAMGAAARIKVQNEHSLDAMAAAYEALYGELIDVR